MCLSIFLVFSGSLLCIESVATVSLCVYVYIQTDGEVLNQNVQEDLSLFCLKMTWEVAACIISWRTGKLFILA